ncbi:MAG: WbqC family protein [Gammaproteobacteria bacterium]
MTEVDLANRPGAERTAVIIQPCLFPWRGQFDLMSRADVVVFLDTVQYVRRSWYNRNRIAGEKGPHWITVPVRTKGQYDAPIAEIEIDDSQRWRRKLLASVEHAYRRCEHFERYFAPLSALVNRDWSRLSPLAMASVRWAFEWLGREPEFLVASDLPVTATEPVARLVALCEEVGATRYLSGPAARDYIGDGAPFGAAGIGLEWMEYDYPAYPQVRSADVPLSILDLLFNAGPDAARYIWPEDDRGSRLGRD